MNTESIHYTGYKESLHTEKSFRNLIKSTQNQIVFRFRCNQIVLRTSVWFQINRIMVNTI